MTNITNFDFENIIFLEHLPSITYTKPYCNSYSFISGDYKRGRSADSFGVIITISDNTAEKR